MTDPLSADSYRPLDRRGSSMTCVLLDRPGPTMQRVWGSQNVGLYALPAGTGAGPATWCHGSLPDYHAFRGSYGGYAFPLHDRRPTIDATNVSTVLLSSLSTAYGEAIQAGDVFDAILCLLSAHSYTLRFAEDLEDVFPHVPFPARHDVFQDAVRVGREIRAVETFERAPAETYPPPWLRATRKRNRPGNWDRLSSLMVQSLFVPMAAAESADRPNRCGIFRLAAIAFCHAGSTGGWGCR